MSQGFNPSPSSYMVKVSGLYNTSRESYHAGSYLSDLFDVRNPFRFRDIDELARYMLQQSISPEELQDEGSLSIVSTITRSRWWLDLNYFFKSLNATKYPLITTNRWYLFNLLERNHKFEVRVLKAPLKKIPKESTIVTEAGSRSVTTSATTFLKQYQEDHIAFLLTENTGELRDVKKCIATINASKTGETNSSLSALCSASFVSMPLATDASGLIIRPPLPSFSFLCTSKLDMSLATEIKLDEIKDFFKSGNKEWHLVLQFRYKYEDPGPWIKHLFDDHAKNLKEILEEQKNRDLEKITEKKKMLTSKAGTQQFVREVVEEALSDKEMLAFKGKSRKCVPFNLSLIEIVNDDVRPEWWLDVTCIKYMDSSSRYKA